MELNSQGVILLNRLEESRVGPIITRTMDSLSKNSRCAFNEDEKQKLAQVLDLNQTQLNLLLETFLALILQGTYNLWKPSVLKEKLLESGVRDVICDAIVTSYSSTAKSAVEILRKRLLAPNQLMDVRWELNVTTGSSKQDKVVCPTAVLQIALNDQQTPITFECDKQQLQELYQKVEEIQSQIDALR